MEWSQLHTSHNQETTETDSRDIFIQIYTDVIVWFMLVPLESIVSSWRGTKLEVNHHGKEIQTRLTKHTYNGQKNPDRCWDGRILLITVNQTKTTLYHTCSNIFTIWYLSPPAPAPLYYDIHSRIYNWHTGETVRKTPQYESSYTSMQNARIDQQRKAKEQGTEKLLKTLREHIIKWT